MANEGGRGVCFGRRKARVESVLVLPQPLPGISNGGISIWFCCYVWAFKIGQNQFWHAGTMLVWFLCPRPFPTYSSSCYFSFWQQCRAEELDILRSVIHVFAIFPIPPGNKAVFKSSSTEYKSTYDHGAPWSIKFPIMFSHSLLYYPLDENQPHKSYPNYIRIVWRLDWRILGKIDRVQRQWHVLFSPKPFLAGLWLFVLRLRKTELRLAGSMLYAITFVATARWLTDGRRPQWILGVSIKEWIFAFSIWAI